MPRVMEGGKTHRASEGNDVGDIVWSVHRVWAVRALLRKFRVVRHDKRETLAVDNMPVERVELRSFKPIRRKVLSIVSSRCIVDVRTWTHDIASSVRSMSDTGKLKVDHDSQISAWTEEAKGLTY